MITCAILRAVLPGCATAAWLCRPRDGGGGPLVAALIPAVVQLSAICLCCHGVVVLSNPALFKPPLCPADELPKVSGAGAQCRLSQQRKRFMHTPSSRNRKAKKAKDVAG
jgi:hypothetical protein